MPSTLCEIGLQQHLQHQREEDTSHRAAARGNRELRRTPGDLHPLLDVSALEERRFTDTNESIMLLEQIKMKSKTRLDRSQMMLQPTTSYLSKFANKLTHNA